jgi:hypothetical protein
LAHQACHARQLQRQQISSATKIHAPERINLSNFCRDMCSSSRTESPWVIKARDKTFPLQSDMLLHADIILEQRTIMSWLLEPLLSVRM